jgi:hypothetical protein
LHRANCMLFARSTVKRSRGEKQHRILNVVPYVDPGCFLEPRSPGGVRSASWGWAGPSGANVVREDVRSLRIHQALARMECQGSAHIWHSAHPGVET